MRNFVERNAELGDACEARCGHRNAVGVHRGFLGTSIFATGVAAKSGAPHVRLSGQGKWAHVDDCSREFAGDVEAAAVKFFVAPRTLDE